MNFHRNRNRAAGSILAAAFLAAFLGTWVGPAGTMPSAIGQTTPPKSNVPINDSDIPAALRGEFDTGDIAAATAWADKLQLADWLGPLAPLALSPFFGVLCLSGLSLWGPGWVTDNALLGSASPLCSVPLFVAFALLTLATSLPRLTKVSKPFAQAADRLEAYAVIVILLVIKVMSSLGDTADAGTGEAIAMVAQPVVQMGVFSFTIETLLMIAMALNVLVINSVKFFFELLVWLTPFPTVDAIFEVANKTTCAALMTLYAANPWAASLLNVAIFVAALLVFRWIGRRVQFHRAMLTDPLLSWLWPGYAKASPLGWVGFCDGAAGPFPARTCLRLVRDGSTSRLVPHQRWSPLNWGHGRRELRVVATPPGQLKRGWLSHSIDILVEAPDPADPPIPVTLWISRRHDKEMVQMVTAYGLQSTPDPAGGDAAGSPRDAKFGLT